MNRSGLSIALVMSIVLIAAVGSGFAVTYTAITTSTDNVVDYKGNTIDILNSSGTPIGNSVTIAGPTANIVDDQLVVTHKTVWINSYTLKVNAAAAARRATIAAAPIKVEEGAAGR